jgi:hypothetical protein
MTSRHHSLESSKMDLRKGSQDLLETRIQVAQDDLGYILIHAHRLSLFVNILQNWSS